MSKQKSRFVCQKCGFVSAKWLGQCPECASWNAFEEEVVVSPQKQRGVLSSQVQPMPLASIDEMEATRLSTAFPEVDRVLGGGLMPSSLILLSGDPGIGKSTLTLQLLAAFKGPSLYVSGEESRGQIRNRAERLGIRGDDILVLTESNIIQLDAVIQKMKPGFLVLDSVQTLFDPEVGSASGNVSQLRAVTAKAMEWAKGLGIITLLVGHVTKEGSVAGPRVLEHMVDLVLFLEGDRHYHYRVLRALKNRFGSTQEIGLFDMTERGLIEVVDPSSAFLSDRLPDAGGSAITATLEGSRPILMEIQSLVVKSYLSNPRRMTSGADFNRVAMILAVLEKRVGVGLSDQDVYLNVVGGLRISEPACDLAMALAMVSAFLDRPIPADLLAIGEIGLTGEIRTVPRLQRRLKEAAHLGFRKAIVPAGSEIDPIKNFDIVEAGRVSDVLSMVWEGE